MEGRPFEVVEARDGKRVLLSVRGEIDLATVGELRAALERAAAGASDVHVDLTEVGFMDSTGLSALVVSHRAIPRLVVICPPGPAYRALEVAGLLELLNVDEALDAA